VCSSDLVCIQFSDELVTSGVDYSSFVTVDTSPAGALEVTEKQICVEGLAHSKSYRVALRSGLPSTVGEVLEKPVVINAYVRDRAPSVRFTGNRFVLPTTSRHSIPIVSINADAANLELFRVGERALTTLLSGSSFLAQLGGYGLDKVRDDFGQAVWKGVLELQREQNRETTTGFPVDTALPNREPGVYVLTAEPEQVESEYWEGRATQWFVISDIGLTTYSGTDGLAVISRSLDTAKPIGGLEISLLARNNEILATAITDTDGVVRFAAGLIRGKAGLAPMLLIAKNDSQNPDFSFLDMSGAGYDFSDRGVEGRPTPGPIDIFLYNERGIYRAGEDVHSVALMRDDSAAAVENVPLTFIYKRPDGVEAKRVSSTAANLGGHAVTYGLADNAMRGTWTLQVFLDPDDSPIGEKKFLVEDFVPDRIEFDLTSVDKEILPRQNARIELSGRYLYGAPANGLSLEGEVRVRTIRENESHSGFWFGLEDEEDNGSQVYPLAELPLTDAAGKAVILAGVGELPATTRPMMADIVVRMQELGGRAVERKLELPVVSAGPMIGVRPEFDLDGLSENSVAEFSIIAIDQESKRVDLAGLNWSLHKLERNYQWYRQGGNWRYESVTIPTQVGDGEISASAADLVKISAPVKWGQYRLDVESADPNGPATSIEFSAGWVVQAGSAETPDALEIALDRNKYSVGDVARLSVSPRFAGEMFVTIGANQTREILTASVPSEGLTLNIPVKKEWGAGVYVTATLIRPGSAKASRLPTRAIGTSWLQVDPGPRKLEINMALAEKIRPDQKLSIPISVGGLKAGDKAFVTVAAVDVGILNLTRYEPPEPSDWFHGQRALGLEVRDMYGRLIDGSLGTLGRLRTGGDAPGLAAEGSPPTQELLALFSGVVKLDDNGQATIEFDLPKFNGTARVMAVAWSSNGVGSAHSDIIIRDPVVVTASLPKVMAPGDLTQAIIEISNTDGPAGSYSISISSNDVIAVDGDVAQTIELSVGERKSVIVPVRANFPGSAELFVTASHESGTEVSVAHLVTVRPATLPITSRSVFAIAGNGGNFNINKDLLTGNILDGAKIAVSVSSSAAFDLPGLLMKLDTYPYGCAEQTTSRALPLLYMSELGVSPLFLKPDEITKRVNGAIKRVLSYQSSSGSFGLWSPEIGRAHV